jgi:mannose/cellobiose epimerase-like protein (N-acyl-D-glucosamine 2-epimerase family)
MPSSLPAAQDALVMLRGLGTLFPDRRASRGNPRQSCRAMSTRLHAYAHAARAGVGHARQFMEETCSLLIDHCWQERTGMFEEVEPVAAQDADCTDAVNLSACSALLCAFEACGNPAYLRYAEAASAAVHRGSVLRAGAPCAPARSYQWAAVLLKLESHPVALRRSGAWMAPQAGRLLASVMDMPGAHAGNCGDAILASLATQAEIAAVAARWADRTGAYHAASWCERLANRLDRATPASLQMDADGMLRLLEAIDLTAPSRQGLL